VVGADYARGHVPGVAGCSGHLRVVPRGERTQIVEQSYRSCLGVMSLAKKPGGMARLEDSCSRALAATPAPSYTLIKKLWTGWTPPIEAPPAPSLGGAGFVRGSDYYGSRS